MATYDAEIIEPPPSLEAARDAKDAEITMASSTPSTPRVSIDRDGVDRRSVR